MHAGTGQGERVQEQTTFQYQPWQQQQPLRQESNNFHQVDFMQQRRAVQMDLEPDVEADVGDDAKDDRE